MQFKIDRDLLRWDIEGNCSQIHLTVSIDARNNEEDARTASSALDQSAETEDDGSFVLLNNLSLA